MKDALEQIKDLLIERNNLVDLKDKLSLEELNTKIQLEQDFYVKVLEVGTTKNAQDYLACMKMSVLQLLAK